MTRQWMRIDELPAIGGTVMNHAARIAPDLDKSNLAKQLDLSLDRADWVYAELAKTTINPVTYPMGLPVSIPTDEELIDMHSRLDSNRTKKQVHERSRLDRLSELQDADAKCEARARAGFLNIVKNERGEYKRWLCTFMPVDPKSRVTYNEGPPKSWCAWPWVFEWDPDENVLATLDGFCALGALKDLPAPWPEWQRARHRLDDWVMANGPSRAAMDAALKRHLPTRSEDANTGLGEAGPEVVRNR